MRIEKKTNTRRTKRWTDYSHRKKERKTQEELEGGQIIPIERKKEKYKKNRRWTDYSHRKNVRKTQEELEGR